MVFAVPTPEIVLQAVKKDYQLKLEAEMEQRVEAYGQKTTVVKAGEELERSKRKLPSVQAYHKKKKKKKKKQ